MARDDAPPFGRGDTWYQFAGTTAMDPTDQDGSNIEGKEWRFEDVAYGTNQYVTVRAVRNVAAFNILPGRLVNLQTSGTSFTAFGNRVDGYESVDAGRGYPADEFLPPGGCPPNDIFFIVVKGPALCKTSLNGDARNVINVGDKVVGVTAATSGATTAGRIQEINTAAETGPQLFNLVGTAMSAATTANTDAYLLVDVGKW